MSLDEYLKQMKEGQKKIYFVCSLGKAEAFRSPFMEPFKDSDVPVLIVTN